MLRYVYLVLAVILAASVVPADSIRVGDEFHRDVYIRTTNDFYYVYHPDEGRKERFSRRRALVKDVNISADAAYRESLLERYHAAKAERAARASDPDPAPRSTVAAPTLDGDLVKHRREVQDLAVFEAQLAHWKTLSEETREAIQAGLHETLAERTARRAAERAESLARIEELGGTKAIVEEELAAAAEARAAAVDRARAEDDSDFYLRAYQHSKGYVGPFFHLFRDEDENLRALSFYHYTEDPWLYDVALAERARTQEEIEAAESAYAARAAEYGSTLETVEHAMTQRERVARAAVSKAFDDKRRYGSRQARVATLSEAAEAGYRPQLRADPIASWSGASAKRLPEFTVGRGLWRIECSLAEAAGDDGFAVTVYDADSGMPFTRITGPDFLGMRMRVFDRPGRYYLAVEQQGLRTVPYEIAVSSVEFR